MSISLPNRSRWKRIANDPRYKGGNMTGAAKKMEKIKKGLSNHPGQEVLRLANEGVSMTTLTKNWMS